MNESVKVIFGLFGGLALFLFGMNTMSDYLQKTAGEKMKKVLGFLTRNPIMGALAGALVTAVLQSSSATTVMVIGFVSAGLMSLPQAIAVIFGANIGTTMTAQIMAFKISNYIYPIIFVGFMLSFVFKKEKIKNLGMVLFSFGLLFEGIEIMGSVMKPLANSPIFLDLMGKVTDIPVLGVILGSVMTLVVQSSSATIAVLQNFAEQPGADGVTSVLGLTGAIPILLGDNIGTTITALLASIGQSKNAKRTAVAHSVFNISGSCVCLLFIPYLADFVRFISPKGDEIDVISRQIANAHTTFNIGCTLLWLPLIPLMVKIVKLIIRGKDEEKIEAFEPKYLEDRMINQPLTAMYMASREILRLAEYSESMIGNLKLTMSGSEPKTSMEHFQEDYRAVKKLQEAISQYITRMFSSGNLTEVQAERTASLMSVMNDVDRVADRCKEVADLVAKIYQSGSKLSKEAMGELGECVDIADRLFVLAVEAVKEGDLEAANRVLKEKNKMRKAQKQHNKAHLARVKKKQCSPDLTGDYAGILYSLDRLAENCVSIAEEALEHKSFTQLDVDRMLSQGAE